MLTKEILKQLKSIKAVSVTKLTDINICSNTKLEKVFFAFNNI